ncbi:MAG: type II secretion system protein J [Phycisphaerae bacterium]
MFLARNHPRARGVTLLEMALAMGLLVTVTSLTYWFYSTALATRETETETARKLRLIRVTLRQLADEIRQVSVISNDGRVGILGEPERIWLSTLRVPTRSMVPQASSSIDYKHQGQTDLIKVEYGIARHPDITHEDGYELPLGMTRIEIPVPRKDSAQTGKAFEGRSGKELGGLDAASVVEQGAEAEEAALFGDEDQGDPVSLGPDINWQELYAPEIKFLRFCYFDGTTWWNDWHVTGENPLPQLVQITVGFEGGPPFGEGLDSKEDEQFCDCMNEDPADCEPLPQDRFSTIVRVVQADSLFRSRVSRETQAVMEELTGGQGDAEDTQP